MSRLLGVCLVALTLTTCIMFSVAAQAPPLQKGISVKMAVTRNAVPWPDADKTDALVVAVTQDGGVYLGIAPATPAALAERLKAGLSNKPEKTLYVKADARTQYAQVEKVLDAARTAGLQSLILLTAQRGARKPGARVLPQGIKILVARPSGNASNAAVIDLVRSGQQAPTLKVNSRQISWADLQSTLGHLFQNRKDKVVLIKADRSLLFADVVEVSDAGRPAGAEVVLAKPGH
jgi:biopolymer transport protein ExbD